MSLYSLKERIFHGRSGQSRYWALVDRMGELTRSALDLNSALPVAAGELGRAFDVARAAILLRQEKGFKSAGDYCAPEIGPLTRENLRLLDREIARQFASKTSITEITKDEIASKFKALFEGILSREASRPHIGSIIVAPLVNGPHATGAVVLYGNSNRRWSNGEKQALGTVISNLALTVYHFQAQERARIAADREVLTNHLLTAIRSAVSVDEVLKAAVSGIGQALGVTRVVIYMHPQNDSGGAAIQGLTSVLTARAEYRTSVLVPSLLNKEFDLEGSPLLGQLLAGEMVAIPDTNTSHPIVRAIYIRLGVRALALAPIAYNGHTVAALALEQFDEPREFSEDEIKLIRTVTEQTAVALFQAQLYREAQEAARRESLIRKINAAIHSSLDPDAVLQAIVNELGKAFSVCRCRLALLPSPLPEAVPITHEYVAECCSNRPPAIDSIPVTNPPFLRTVFAAREPLIMDDVLTDPRLAPLNEKFRAAGVKTLLTTAIRIGERPIGVFSLHHCEEPHTWTQGEIDTIQPIVEQAAVAIRQAELYREVRESAMRAALVNQIIASIRRSLDLNETLQVAVEELGRALGADRTSVRKIEGEDTEVLTEHLSHPSLSLGNVRATKDNYIVNYLRETRRTLIIDDVRAFIAAHPEVAATVHIWQIEPVNLSQIVCPIFVNGEFWGGISIGQTSRARKWTASEIALIEAVAAQVEVAVSHSHLFEGAKHAAEREALISHIIHGINQSNKLDEIFPIVASNLGDHLATDALLITTLDEENNQWVIECAYGNGQVSKPGKRYGVKDFMSLSTLVEDDVILCNDAETDARFAPYLDRFLRPAGTRAFMAVRLFYKGQPRLVITAIMKSGPRAWTNDEVEIIRAATAQVLIAIQRAELFEQVSHGKYEWESTFDALTDGIFIFDHRGALRRVNEAGAAFEGSSVRDLIGRPCCTLLQGIEGETCRVAEVLKNGRPVTFELVPERLARPVLVTMSPLTSGFRGQFHGGASATGGDERGNHNGSLGAVCIVRDLSELRAAEAAAREQRSFLVKLIEHANDAIFAFSPQGRLVWFNEQLCSLSGYSREELSASDYRQFLTSDEKKLAVDRFTGALEGVAQTFEMQALKKNGEPRLLLITYTPIYDEGGVTSVLTIARDITEERLARERAAQADKLRALGQLASGVAHNFNNILAAILGHAQLIKRDCKDERTIQRMDIIERAALDGAQTVKRIQGFGLQQTAEVDESFDLNQLVQDSTHLTRARWCDEAHARGLHYEVELDLKPVPLARGAASELREVFVNIILNALDAMPQGGRLRIATEAQGSGVRVSFTDSGIGMSREVSEHIFEPFFTTKGVSGMGLGLAVSYSIVERHGGRIEIRSQPGRGTSFTIILPTGRTAKPKPTRDQRLKVKASSILVIDDDERVREALVGMLSSAGHRTDHAANGREALSKMERDGFDLVFTDLSMPEMDGWAVASEIRRRWPAVKIVLITGYAVPPETVNHHRDLVNEVIFKPIRLDDISATLSQVLAQPGPFPI
jgi:PAS domain S-box-containing protein